MADDVYGSRPTMAAKNTEARKPLSAKAQHALLDAAAADLLRFVAARKIVVAKRVGRVG